MDLRAKYDQAIQTAKRLGFQGAATQEGDKLHFKGTVHSEDEKNQIWNAIKTVPEWKNDINALIRENQAEITKIMNGYHIPLLNTRGELIQ